MIARSSLTSRNAPMLAAGALLVLLCAASIGCAFTAFYGIDGPALEPAIAPAFAVPALQSPVAQPVAGVAEPARCIGAPGIRVRRNGHSACKMADLPPV